MVIRLMATASAWDPIGRMLKITLVMSARLSRIPKKMFIAGRKITVEGPGDPNTALLNEKTGPIEANGAGGSSSACEALGSCND